MRRVISRGTTSNNDAVLNCKFNNDNKRRSKFACKKLACKYCGPRIQEDKKLAVQNRVEDFELYNMVTLTSPPSAPLKAVDQFRKLKNNMKTISKMRNYLKYYNRANASTYAKHIFKLYSVERFNIWLHIIQPNRMSNKTIYCKEIIAALQNRSLPEYLSQYGSPLSKIACNRLTTIYFDMYLGYDKKQLKNTGLLNSFFGEINSCLQEIFNYLYMTDSECRGFIDTEVDCRFQFLFDMDFKYISRIEFTKSGLPHIHFVTNMYIPYLYQEGIFQQGLFNNAKKYPFDWQAAEPLAIYLTKNYTDEDLFREALSVARSIDSTTNIKSENINQLHSSRGIVLELQKPNIKYITDSKKPTYTPSPNNHYKKISELQSKLKQCKKNLTLMKYKGKTALVKSELVKITALSEDIARESEVFLQDELKRFQNVLQPLPRVNHRSTQPSLTQEQLNFLEAVFGWLQMVFLTGSAGTGKSSCIAEFIKQFNLEGDHQELRILCTAPTGKAVQRMYELVEKTCLEMLNYITFKTIHGAMYSLYGENETISKFSFHERHRADFNLVIIDEAGMADQLLCAQLLNGLNDTCRIVFVGDPKQLKPVNGSSVLEYADIVPENHYHLTINHRSTDSIIELAYSFDGQYKGDIFTNINGNYDETIRLATTENYSVISSTHIQVDAINRNITENYPIKGRKGYHYKIGMPVMFLKNDRRGILNGQIATIESYDPYSRIFTFDCGVQVSLDESIEMFVPGYALTCHKAQGSEYDNVVVLLDHSDVLLTPEWVYTAVTRAKKNIKLLKVDGVDEKLLYSEKVHNDNAILKPQQKTMS